MNVNGLHPTSFTGGLPEGDSNRPENLGSPPPEIGTAAASRSDMTANAEKLKSNGAEVTRHVATRFSDDGLTCVFMDPTRILSKTDGAARMAQALSVLAGILNACSSRFRF